jgi:hypothetical protein
MSGSDQEKYSGSFEQKSDVVAHDQPGPNEDAPYYDKRTENKLIRKIDFRLLPILGALYSIALIDRVNVRNLRLPRKFTDTDGIRSPMPESRVWERTFI